MRNSIMRDYFAADLLSWVKLQQRTKPIVEDLRQISSCEHLSRLSASAAHRSFLRACHSTESKVSMNSDTLQALLSDLHVSI